jgi:F-type H+-transporting ATPase subunit gamma
MAMVSTAKATKVIGGIRASRPYAERLAGFVKALSQSCEDHPLFIANPDAEKNLLVVVTANRGLCGGYNANIIRLAMAQVSDDTEVWMYGKKGASAFRFAGIELAKTNSELKDNPTFDEAIEISDLLVDAYTSGLYREIKVVSSEFISAGQQVAAVKSLLPLKTEEMNTEDVEDDAANDAGFEPIYHPDKKSILWDLIPKVMRVKTYRILLDAAASEHLARQMAMNSASDNASDMVKSLTLSYNRARQAQITTEISEIVGGAEALN